MSLSAPDSLRFCPFQPKPFYDFHPASITFDHHTRQQARSHCLAFGTSLSLCSQPCLAVPRQGWLPVSLSSAFPPGPFCFPCALALQGEASPGAGLPSAALIYDALVISSDINPAPVCLPVSHPSSAVSVIVSSLVVVFQHFPLFVFFTRGCPLWDVTALIAYKWKVGDFMLRGVPLVAATIQEWHLPVFRT